MAHRSLLRHVVALAGLTLVACGGDNGPSAPAPSGGTVTDVAAADLRYLREEEKLARDVYRTLFEQWKLKPHENISASEETHTTRVRDLLASFGVADPVTDDTVGTFVNADLRELYAGLVATGKKSETASLEVGATVEDLDLRDIEQMKARTGDANVLRTYAALQCGSRNHLRTFTAQLSARGVTYAPRYISAADFAGIVSASNEKCAF